MKVYAYGVARNRLQQAAKRLGVPAIIVRDVSEADALVTLRTYYRNRQQTVIEAEQRGMPIYVLRANTVAQVEQFLGDLYNLSAAPLRDNMEDIRSETQQAIAAVLTANAGWTCPRVHHWCEDSNTKWRAALSWSVIRMAKSRAGM